jgi:hypothetical protein
MHGEGGTNRKSGKSTRGRGKMAVRQLYCVFIVYIDKLLVDIISAAEFHQGDDIQRQKCVCGLSSVFVESKHTRKKIGRTLKNCTCASSSSIPGKVELESMYKTEQIKFKLPGNISMVVNLTHWQPSGSFQPNNLT